MWNKSKKLLALLVCINFMQFGAIAAALEADEDQAAPGGSTRVMNMAKGINPHPSLVRVP